MKIYKQEFRVTFYTSNCSFEQGQLTAQATLLNMILQYAKHGFIDYTLYQNEGKTQGPFPNYTIVKIEDWCFEWVAYDKHIECVDIYFTI